MTFLAPCITYGLHWFRHFIVLCRCHDSHSDIKRMSMRNPTALPLACCLLLASLLHVCAADLKTYMDVYQKNSDEIRQGYKLKFANLRSEYQTSLETLKTHAQRKGDLQVTKDTLAEIARFQAMKSMPPVENTSEVPEIKTLQEAYVDKYSQLEMELTSQIGALAVKYEQALDRLQKELTKAGELDAATAVMAERTKAQARIKGASELLSTLKEAVAKKTTAVSQSAKITEAVVEKEIPEPEEIALDAVKGEVTGNIKLNANGNFFEFWGDPEASVRWPSQKIPPGEYDVSVTYSAAGNAHGRFVFHIGGEHLSGESTDTGGWDKYERRQVGKVKISDKKCSVSVQATTITGKFLWNLRTVYLTPLPVTRSGLKAKP